jgi:AcrR family transcriptional regulator
MHKWLATSGRFVPGAAGACLAGAHGLEAAPWRSGTTSWSAHRSGRRASAWIGDEKKQEGRDDTDRADVLSALAHIAQRYMEVVMAPDAVRLYRLIIAEGVRFPELTRIFHQIGPDRTNAHLAGMLSVWRERGLIRLGDPQLAAVQFFDSVSGDLHRRAMAGIIPKNLRAAVKRSIDHAVQVFWNGIRVDGRPVGSG